MQHKYALPGHSERQIEKAFEKMIGKRYSGKVYDMKEKWLKDGMPSVNCTPDVWKKWEEHWGTEKFKRNSKIAKTNRNSKEGQGSVHTGGSINLSETWDRMVNLLNLLYVCGLSNTFFESYKLLLFDKILNIFFCFFICYKKKKHGDKADAIAVFIATHTTEAPDGSGPQWINPYFLGLLVSVY